MITRIAHQVQLMEKYIQEDPALSTAAMASRKSKLLKILAWLKLTYQTFPTHGIAPSLSPNHIAQILLKVYWKTKEFSQINIEVEAVDSSYNQFSPAYFLARDDKGLVCAGTRCCES